LGITAGVATKASAPPILAIISLPILFAAGMSLMDTADGAFMMQAYGWAFSNPLRKVFYNITVTTLSVAIALLIGTIELIAVLADRLHLHRGFFGLFAHLSTDFQVLGYIIVGMFVVAWAGSVLIWKTRHIEERWGHHLVAKEPAVELERSNESEAART
jgi:high-affinity nickel-transport protein